MENRIYEKKIERKLQRESIDLWEISNRWQSCKDVRYWDSNKEKITKKIIKNKYKYNIYIYKYIKRNSDMRLLDTTLWTK